MIKGKKGTLATEAYSRSLMLRNMYSIEYTAAFDIYELAQKLGLEIRFVDIPGMEALYFQNGGPKAQPEIWISSHRPSGRQFFNCAHEIGHHVFNHGSKLDELQIEKSNTGMSNNKEYIADTFAGFLLMPKTLVNNAYYSRGWNTSTTSPIEIYTISGWIGVGYSTLIHHMHNSLKLISSSTADSLLAFRPKDIRSRMLGFQSNSNLIAVDFNWVSRAIDIQIEDLILLPKSTKAEGNCVQLVKEYKNDQTLYKGIFPGIGRFYHTESSWASYVRVSKRGYSGLGRYRHLEDPDYE
jgi:hypothetical protein